MSFEREATEWTGIRSLMLDFVIKEGFQKREQLHCRVAETSEKSDTFNQG